MLSFEKIAVSVGKTTAKMKERVCGTMDGATSSMKWGIIATLQMIAKQLLIGVNLKGVFVVKVAVRCHLVVVQIKVYLVINVESSDVKTRMFVNGVKESVRLKLQSQTSQNFSHGFLATGLGTVNNKPKKVGRNGYHHIGCPFPISMIDSDVSIELELKIGVKKNKYCYESVTANTVLLKTSS